jgi:hypothetical protein
MNRDTCVVNSSVRQSVRSCAYVTYIGGNGRGERNVALVNIEKIAKALKVSLSKLFSGI